MRIKILTIAILVMIFFVGCKDNSKGLNQNSANEESQTKSDENTDINLLDNTEDEDEISSIDEEGESEQLADNVDAEIHALKIDEPYNSADLNIEILGLETYETLETEKYTDTASEGKEYVVVYLKINNTSVQDEYFNYNDLNSFVDGTVVNTTYLLNNPKDYVSIFNVLPANTETKGYLVYQVPKDWQQLKIEYRGWEMTKGIKLEFLLNSSEIKEVKAFGSEFYAPNK